MPSDGLPPNTDEHLDAARLVLAPGVLAWATDRVFVEDHCANCVSPLAADAAGLFCSSWCKETASNVRYFRRVFRDGRSQDPDVQEAIGTRLAFLTSGGYGVLGRTLSPSTRAQVIDRDSGACVSCGKPGNEIDHIDGSSPELSNLQLLCHRCHAVKTAAAMVPTSDTHKALVTGLMVDRVMPEQPRLLADDDQSWATIWRRLTAERKERLGTPGTASTAGPTSTSSPRRSRLAPRARARDEIDRGTMPPMPTSVHDVLDQLRAVATSEADKGTRFEQLMVAFLKADPTYAEQFSDVFAWQDWPGRGGKHDTGIDLVAVDRQTGGNVAIQCKFYATGHHVSKPDIDSFLAASGATGFTRRIIVSTGADWGPNAEAALAEQSIPVSRIGMGDLAASTIDWSQFTWSTPDVLATRGKKTARPHQRTAIEKVAAGLAERGRGKLIMACGTGKTFTSLRLAEQHVGAGGTVLFLVPSISLLSQTVREWASEAELPMEMLAICSDPKATKRSGAAEDISAVDIALPATTNLDLLGQRWAAATSDSTAMTVVFSTYQSIDVVAAARKAGGFAPFDLIICDEAHRTTGVTVAGSDESSFVRVHDNTFLPATARLYMTATPRLFGDDSKKKAADADAVIASMDDEDTYGPELHRLGFGEAVEKKLLTDYRVLVLAVDEEYVSGNFQQELATSGEIPLGDAARIVGCWNGLAKHFDTTADESDHPMRRAVAFAKDINASKTVAASFPLLVDRHIQTMDLDPATEPHAPGREAGLRVECEHVDGTYNALARNERLDWLKAESPQGTCRILTNARCLSEGVDVPSLDAVMFLTPRSSEVDVVQSVGRVMRTSPGKDYGYIILPVAVPSGVAPEAALRDNEKYKVVWQVLQALRAHDDRFNATINQIDLNTHRPDKIRVIGVTGPDTTPGSDTTSPGTAVQGALSLDMGLWQDGIYAKIVAKVGERRYWETWAGDVALIAAQLTTRITGILSTPDTATSTEFEKFLDGLRGNLNEAITTEDAVEMLAQHLITRPIFQSFFGAYDFTGSNPVARIMETMLDALDEHALDTETTSLDRFYASVALRLDDIDNAAGRQRILVELYDKFFAKAFKRRVDKLGIVYTPIEITDFILRSADELLREHFGQGLTDEGVHILDGFTGTGTFIVRLLQLDLIRPEDLIRKYAHEIHANEILLLAYYIAAVNIESTYLDARRTTGPEHSDMIGYEPFPGLVLTDTFQSYEEGGRLDDQVFVANNERLTRQKNLPITVIMGNPPYSSGQDSANDNNANDTYPGLDASIRATYAARSTATLKNSLYDSYIRAIRWATLRLADRGVIAFVTNGGWLNSNSADGMRLTMAAEFSDIHIYNLRGNMRSSEWRKEGGQIFGSGSQATVAVTILVRDPTHPGPARVHYTDIGDYLTREQKLATINTAKSVAGLQTTTITPNQHGDWLHQRSTDFDTFLPIGNKTGGSTVFELFSGGLKTNRDAWCYNFSRRSVDANMRRSIQFANSEIARLTDCDPDNRELHLDRDPSQISWDYSNVQDIRKGRRREFNPTADRIANYRPFTCLHSYFDPSWNNRQYRLKDLFPTPAHPNYGFYQVGAGSAVPFSVLMLDAMPDLHVTGAGSGGQFFARWRYEEIIDDHATLALITGGSDGEVIDGYRRIDNITDTAHAEFLAAYGDAISKDDVFFYIYGLLHSPDYRATYASDLKKTLPRIPLVTDPWPYIAAGRELSELHLGYESTDPYPLEGVPAPTASAGHAAYGYYRVSKMAFAKTRDPETKKLVADKSAIVYNGHITVTGIPDEAHRYLLGSRSAIEWIIDRYQVKQDKASGIVNDPNDWSREVSNPRYIFDLLARIVTVSVKTMKIVDALPALDIRAAK